MKSAKVWSKWGRLLVSGLLALFVLASSGSFSAWVVHAEGSRDLYPSGAAGYRANIEWRTSYFGNNFLLRRTLLQVYAEPGEVILLGSSAVGVGDGNILLYSSDQVTEPIGNETVNGAPDFNCDDQRAGAGGLPANPDRGRITSRALELAGPQSASSPGGNPGYLPCYFVVPPNNSPGGSTDNIYFVAFLGPSGDDTDEECNNTTGCTGEIELTSSANFNASQETSVAAWDVTVRSDVDSTTDITGRLFADYLAMITGRVDRPMNSTLYALTTDAYRYQVGLRGLDPYGFVLYSNQIGFLNSDGTPLLHDVVGEENQLNTLLGGVSLAEPTHRLFFNNPSVEARLALNGIAEPITPQINSFVFDGVVGGNTTLVGAGGVFNLNINVDGIFLLVISRDGANFDPELPENRVLVGIGSTGPQPISWDGLDNASNPFPVGTYDARILLRAGEVHFPLLDVESSQQGGPQYELINPPGGSGSCPLGCFTGFYNDQGYITANGTPVGTLGQVLEPGNNPPDPSRSDPFVGFDTRSDQHAFGDGTPAGFGDKKGLDLWTYFPVEAITPLNIVASEIILGISKVPDVSCHTTGQQQTINYTIDYRNDGNDVAFNAAITDTLPASTTFDSCSGGLSCNETSPGSGVVVYSLGDLAAGTFGSVGLTVQVDAAAPAQLTNLVQLGAVDNTGNAQTVEDTDVLDPCPLDISLVLNKSSDVSCHRTGRSQTVNYTIDYRNGGTDDAFNVAITDTLPVSTTYESGSCGGAGVVSCDETAPGSGVVEFLLGDLAAGEKGSVGLTVQVDEDAPDRLTNLAELDAVDILANALAAADTDVLDPCSTSGSGGDRDRDSDSDRDPTSTPVPPPPATPVAQAAAELPVVFLPETGLREVPWFNNGVIAATTLLLTLGGTTAVMLYLRNKRKK